MLTVTLLNVAIYHNFLERNEIWQGIQHDLIKEQKSATDTTLKRIRTCKITETSPEKLRRLPPRNYGDFPQEMILSNIWLNQILLIYYIQRDYETLSFLFLYYFVGDWMLIKWLISLKMWTPNFKRVVPFLRAYRFPLSVRPSFLCPYVHHVTFVPNTDFVAASVSERKVPKIYTNIYHDEILCTWVYVFTCLLLCRTSNTSLISLDCGITAPNVIYCSYLW